MDTRFSEKAKAIGSPGEAKDKKAVLCFLRRIACRIGRAVKELIHLGLSQRLGLINHGCPEQSNSSFKDRSCLNYSKLYHSTMRI